MNVHTPPTGRNSARSELERTPDDVSSQGSDAYERARSALVSAFDGSRDALRRAYGQTTRWGENNPGTFLLIGLLLGAGLGLLLSLRGRDARA